MPVDKKSDHVGNHGGAYLDNDGMRKQFTIVDHDKKTKIASIPPITDEELKKLQSSMDVYLEETIQTVLSLPAVNIVDASSGIYNNLIERTNTAIVWNEKAVREHLSNERTSFLPTMLWRRTVHANHWFHPMWIEGDLDAIKRGDWKKLTS